MVTVTCRQKYEDYAVNGGRKKVGFGGGAGQTRRVKRRDCGAEDDNHEAGWEQLEE